jgi:hypothetical protein
MRGIYIEIRFSCAYRLLSVILHGMYVYVPSTLGPTVQYLLPRYPLTFKMWFAI